jgi:hypothetical protein
MVPTVSAALQLHGRRIATIVAAGGARRQSKSFANLRVEVLGTNLAPSSSFPSGEDIGEDPMTMQQGRGAAQLWVPGDWNGFFGLFTNVVLNVIVLTTLCLFVVHLPADSIVYGRVLPALGIALPIGNLYYAYLALRLAKQEGRSDVTAMPYGPSVPHMFIVVLVIMLPTYLSHEKTDGAEKAALLAWQALPGRSSLA